MTKERSRPAVLKSWTRKQPTASGTMYVTVSYTPRRRPVEVFVTLGKAGADERAWGEAVGRLLSWGLRSGAKLPDAVQNLKGVTSDKVIWDSTRPGTKVLSPADGIAKTLDDFESWRRRKHDTTNR